MHNNSTTEKLLTLGNLEQNSQWPDYAALGFTTADVPSLIEVMCDAALHESEDENELWAPVHAWRALATLGGVDVIGTLFTLAKSGLLDEFGKLELPDVIARMGPDAVPHVHRVLIDEQDCEVSQFAGMTSAVCGPLRRHGA